MLVKKTKEETQIIALYDSSNICSSIYELNDKSLTIIFNNGFQYKYFNVLIEDYLLFENAKSNGSVFSDVIKKKYSNFQKLNKLDNTEILTEIKLLKK